MDLLEQLKEVMAKMNSLEQESRSEAVSVERLEAINDEMDTLIEERTELESKIEKRNKDTFQRAKTVVSQGLNEDQKKAQLEAEAEQRVRQLKQSRAITLDTLDTLKIEHQGSGINPTFNQVSSLLDSVTHKYFPNGETYKQAFIKNYGEGDYTSEGANYNNSEPSWGYAEISKTKITAYTEVSEEFEKLKPVYYLNEIKRNLTISLRKKLAKEIVIGNGESGKLTGVLAPTDKVTALDAAKDLEIDVIDENTLNNIILAHGGDEDIEIGVLVLNKLDLSSFLKVRGSDKKPVYTIDFNNQTINGVRYKISSSVKAHDAASSGEYTMFYGTLGSYELVSFGPIEISKSTDYKFASGQIAYRISGMFGGNVTSHNAFVRIKKKSTAG